MQERTERLFSRRPCSTTGTVPAVDHGVVQAEFRLAVTARCALEELGGCATGPPERRLANGFERALERQLRHVRHGAPGRQRRMVQLVQSVEGQAGLPFNAEVGAAQGEVLRMHR
jgi:hypothetical protein